jgi:hypothetical protein
VRATSRAEGGCAPGAYTPPRICGAGSSSAIRRRGGPPSPRPRSSTRPASGRDWHCRLRPARGD